MIVTLGGSAWSGFFTMFLVCAMMGLCCCCDSGDTTLGGIALGVGLFNIPDRVLSAYVWVSPRVTNYIDVLTWFHF